MTDPRLPSGLRAVADKFSATSEQYASSEQRAGDDLEAVTAAVAALRPAPVLVVDVATGPGSTALALAPVVERVIGTDVSEGMIATARSRAASAGRSNVVFEIAPADDLPIGTGEADAVTCRIAAHHFFDVPAALTEMVRVLRPGGRLVLLDSEAPADPAVAAYLHELESRRDPTHVRSYTAEVWIEMVVDAGFAVETTASYPKPKAFAPWLARGGADEAEQQAVQRLMRDAPDSVRLVLAIEFDDVGDPIRFTDDKLLILATKPGDASKEARP